MKRFWMLGLMTVLIVSFTGAGLAGENEPGALGGTRSVDFVYDQGGAVAPAYCFNVYQDDGMTYLAVQGRGGA